MLHFLYGTDTVLSREKARKIISDFVKKDPTATLIKFDADNFTPASFEEVLYSVGLFSPKIIIDMKFLAEDQSVFSEISQKESLQKMNESQNIFVWTEGLAFSEMKETKDKKDFLSSIKKLSETFEETKAKEVFQKEEFNTFSITDAFGSKDKKKLWVLYQKALMRGISPDEIFNILWWQVKSMILADRTKTATEAGMKDFPYRKAKQFSKNFKPQEIEGVADKMVNLIHQSRRTGGDISILLEKFLLESF